MTRSHVAAAVEAFEVEAAAFMEAVAAGSTAAADVACTPGVFTAAATGVACVLHTPSPGVPDIGIRVIPSPAVPVTVTGDATRIADMVQQQR